MSEIITGITRGGREWTPAFVTALDQGRCIGCGRCFKVCPRNVFELIEREEEIDDDDGDGFSDDTAMVMSLSDPLDCIGCQACSKVCPKDCHSHSPEPLAA